MEYGLIPFIQVKSMAIIAHKLEGEQWNYNIVSYAIYEVVYNIT